MPRIELSSERERKLARTSAHSLRGFLAHHPPRSDQPFCLGVTGDEHRKTVRIPAAVVHALLEVMEDLGEGQAVSLSALDRELTTQQAADLLQVSRPYLIGEILEKGKMRFRRVGTHRRIPYSEVVRYRQERREEQEALLRELAAEAQELELGYD